MLLSEGQMSDYRGAALMIDALPKAKVLLGDRGYDADWFRAALADRKITACIPSKVNRKLPIPHDPALYRQRHKIEIMFGRLKDWRRIHTRYDRCAHTRRRGKTRLGMMTACRAARWRPIPLDGSPRAQVGQYMQIDNFDDPLATPRLNAIAFLT